MPKGKCIKPDMKYVDSSIYYTAYKRFALLATKVISLLYAYAAKGHLLA